MDRLERADYFRCGLDVLSESGVGALTIAELCRRLRVTKGSFYHHFSGMPDYVTALLAYWEHEHSRALITASTAESDPLAQTKLLIDIAVDLPHEAEAALRAWGRSTPEVATVLRRVDDARAEHLTAAAERAFEKNEHDARLAADTALAVLIGTQQRSRPVDRERLRAMLTELYRGAAPPHPHGMAHSADVPSAGAPTACPASTQKPG